MRMKKTGEWKGRTGTLNECACRQKENSEEEKIRCIMIGKREGRKQAETGRKTWNERKLSARRKERKRWNVRLYKDRQTRMKKTGEMRRTEGEPSTILKGRKKWNTSVQDRQTTRKKTGDMGKEWPERADRQLERKKERKWNTLYKDTKWGGRNGRDGKSIAKLNAGRKERGENWDFNILLPSFSPDVCGVGRSSEFQNLCRFQRALGLLQRLLAEYPMKNSVK